MPGTGVCIGPTGLTEMNIGDSQSSLFGADSGRLTVSTTVNGSPLTDIV